MINDESFNTNLLIKYSIEYIEYNAYNLHGQVDEYSDADLHIDVFTLRLWCIP